MIFRMQYLLLWGWTDEALFRELPLEDKGMSTKKTRYFQIVALIS